MNTGVIEFKLNRVKGILGTALSLKDKGLMLEKEIGLEPIYAMLAMGKNLAPIAASLGMSIFELEYVLQRTSSHRKQYMNAISNKLALQSSVALDRYKNIVWMDKEHAAAARHHASMLHRSLNLLNAPSGSEGSGKVIVNNTVVVRDKNDVPPLPDGLEDIIEGEYVDA